MLMEYVNLSIPVGTHNEPLVDVRPDLKMCPSPTRVFTGRQDVIDQMRAYFSSQSRPRHVFVLYGLGGSGKSQIAYKFIEEFQLDGQYDTSCFGYTLPLTPL